MPQAWRCIWPRFHSFFQDDILAVGEKIRGEEVRRTFATCHGDNTLPTVRVATSML